MEESEKPSATRGAAGLRSLAVRGAMVVGLRGIASRLIALAGTIVLARTLPADAFGFFALGAALMTSIGYVVQSGLGAGLIRRSAGPTLAELQAVVAMNGLLLVAVVAVAVAACAAIGGTAITVAMMVALMPVTAFRAPGVIGFERLLSYRKVAQVEIVETAALYGVSSVLVVAGLGLTAVWIGAAVRVVGGTVFMVCTSPQGLVRPRLSGRVVRDLVGFASRFQGVALVHFVRDQGVNLGIATIGGVRMLGTYTIAMHLVQAAQILLEALLRVSYPVMSRLEEHGEDARNVVERTLKVVALCLGLIVAPLCAASVPLIATVFGARWSEAAAVIPPVGLGLMIGGPVIVSAAGYLFAMNAPGVVLRSAVLHTIAWFAVAFPLLQSQGVVAAGLATLAASIVEARVLGSAVRRRTGARLLTPLMTPILTAGAAAGAGALAIAALELDDALEAAMAAVVAASTFAIMLVAFQRDDFAALKRLVHNAIRAAPA